MPKLIIDEGSGTREVELSDGPLTSGRDSTTDIQIDDEQASREHCRFEFADGNWYVVDLGSSNGTRVDEKHITRKQLTDGAVIRIGHTSMSFVGGDQPTPPADSQTPLDAGLSIRANSGPLDGHVFNLEKAVTTLGRSSKCDITLTEGAVSGKHAEFVIDGTTARIVDRDSRNGVRVNGVRVDDSKTVEPGDRIRIGSTIFGLFTGDDTAAGLVDVPDESAEEGADAPATSSGRVKLLALGAAAMVLIAAAVILLLPRTGPPVDKSNLLTKNASFEQPAPGPRQIPGWDLGKGSPDLQRGDAPDGDTALRLTSAVGAGNDVSALCWSSPVEVSPKRTYELSAMLKNSGTESAALCVAWSAPKHPWLENLQLGVPTADAREWQRISETFKPPSWATSARFGCAVIGQGQAKFDAFRLRGTARTEKPKRIAAGRLAFEPGPRGTLTAFADKSPMLCQMRISATAQGRPAGQSLGTLDAGFPRAGAGAVKYTGQLGLDGRARFSETLAADGTNITVKYGINVSAMRDAVIALEWTSPKSLLAAPVTLRTTRGQRSQHKTPFENQSGVNSITFFSGDKRIFLNVTPAATVTAVGESSDEVNWRLEFPLSDPAGRANVFIVWRATDADQDAAVAADLRKAGKFDNSEQFTKAIKAYEDFVKKHPLYASECALAATRLQDVHRNIAARVRTASGLAKRAFASKSESDFAAAMRTCEALSKKLEGHAAATHVAGLLANLKKQHNAVILGRRAKQAATLVAQAKGHVLKKEFTIARVTCEYVISTFPGTPSAAAARAILDKLPAPE